MSGWRSCVALFAALTVASGCSDSEPAEILSITLQRNERFQRAVAGGDEDGARIIESPRHAAISEIRRDSSTQWTGVYVYQPAEDFVGNDQAVLELSRSAGGTESTSRSILLIRFQVRE